MQIRARAQKDLEQLKQACPTLRRCPIHETPDADYRFRIVTVRWRWELVAKHLSESIDYSNFKGKISQVPEQRDKLDMLHRIWSLHHGYQYDLHRPDPMEGEPKLFREAGDPLIDDMDEETESA